MIAAALGKRPSETFRIGYVAGLAHYLSMLYWLLLIPYRWHGLPLAPALGWLALSGFLALFPAAWVWLVVGTNTNSHTESGEREGNESDEILARACDLERGAVLTLPRRTWPARTLWAFSGAMIWVALEMGLARIFGGFPWELLGASQYRLVPLIQVAAVTGVYGVSFLVVWLSLSLVSAALMVIRRPTARSVWVAELFLPVLIIAVLFNLGMRSLTHQPSPARTLKTVLVQPSIPQTLIWDAVNNDARFRELVRISEQALTNYPAQLMIWPEAAVPKMLRYDQATFDAITGLARRHHTWLIVGSDDAESRHNPKDPDDADYFNSSFLISPEGELVQRYVKRNLVIFGEYIPLLDWLPFLKYFTPIQGGFTPGAGPVQFNLKDLGIQTSVLICFEDTFPQLARTDVGPNTDFLVNITNDGWFDNGPAQWQHATTAIFRAVENNLPLIRCSNNGLTCWIDAAGRLREIFHDAQGTIYGSGYLAADLPLPGPSELRTLTFYTRHGDWFGWSCFGLAGWVFLRRVTAFFGARRNR